MIKSLDNIVTLFSGNAWKASSFKPTGRMPIIRIQNIGENKSEEFIYWDEDYNKSFIVKKGDLLLSLSGSIKLDFWDGEPALLNQRIVKISPKDSIDTHWLFFQLKNYIRKITNMGNHALVNNVSLTDLRKLTLNVPVYADQLHIANLLSKAENLISQRKESIRLLDEFLKCTFLEMFYSNPETEKWDEVRFEELADKKKGSMRTGPFGSSLLHSEFTEIGDVKVLGLDNVVTNRFEWKRSRCITNEKYQELKRYRVFPNDVLISIMATLGRTAVVPKDIPICINSKHLAAITLNKKIANPYFVSYSFQSNPLILRQLTNSVKGAIMDGLNLTIICGIKFKLPPVTLQNKFGETFEKTETLKTQYQQSLQESENLYGSLSQKAFKGELSLNGEGLLIAAEPKNIYTHNKPV